MLRNSNAALAVIDQRIAGLSWLERAFSKRSPRKSSKFMKAIAVTIGAFHEALEMQHAAHKSDPMIDE